MVDEYPKIRNVRPLPFIVRGQRMLALQDPHNVADQDELVLMPVETATVIGLFNGQNSISDIQIFLTRMSGGVLFPREAIVKLVEILDEKFLLENDNYRRKLDAFHNEPIRKSALTGKTLPDSAEETEKFLDKVMSHAPELSANSKVKAALCPHIDIARAMKAYAKTYRALQCMEEADLFVIFGTAHYAAPNTRFAFTRKSYETPFGVLPTDEEFVSRVIKKTSRDLFSDEIAHKGEHSIEFQVLFLQHTIGKKRAIRIAPILVGNFEDCIEMGKMPDQEEEILEVLRAIRQTAAEVGEDKICWLASVDLSHVGLRFGDEHAPDERLLHQIRTADMECLEAARNCDSQGFFKSLARHKNRYRVCGLSPIYTLLYMLQGTSVKGDMLEYDQSLEEETGSVVTFSSMVFSEA